MSDLHIPVLLEDVLKMTEGMQSPPKFFLDGTFGRGGHAMAIQRKHPDLTVCGLDQDLDAIEFAKQNFAQKLEKQELEVVHGSFHDIKERIADFKNTQPGSFDLILIDLGVSSPQLDNAERGFSFQQNGPLDMRMDQTKELTAAEIINTWSEQELKDLFYYVGEVRKPGKVVSEILKKRSEKVFETTLELADLIAKADGWRKKGWHPATQYFLALRIQVNQELDPLADAINDLIDVLSEHGRLMIITFHSVEDRIAKVTLKAATDRGSLINKKVVQATWDEKKSNPRARSAKLRGFEKN